jgi:hypothetical protein
MVLIGAGIGLTSAPATESIMGAVPAAKAGVGSAINDATRILGATLGVAVIGSIYASLYSSRLDAALQGKLPPAATAVAHKSVGGAFQTAVRLAAGGRTTLARTLHNAASNAFFDGFAVACLVAAAVALAGAVMAAILIPAQPPAPTERTSMWTTERSIETTASAEAIWRLSADVRGGPTGSPISHTSRFRGRSPWVRCLDDADRTGPRGG